MFVPNKKIASYMKTRMHEGTKVSDMKNNIGAAKVV